ncbi:MAG: hypothetical protein IKN03_06855 [Fibrobacter sp.]|nr:hypothetical protein [Fibrobacter sp.]MBR6855098.1 hypothetical protein [Fibrobacter sp.]
MSTIHCTLDNLAKTLEKEVKKEMKQVKFAAVGALNRVAFDSQKELRDTYSKAFHVRNKTLPRKIEVTKATKDKPVAVVALNAPKTEFMEIHTTGGTAKPTKSRSMAIPDASIQELGRTSTGKMKQSLKPSNLLKYADTHQSKKRGKVAIPHAFKMKTRGGDVVIARRNKADRSEMDFLYREEKEAKIKKSWDFKGIVQNVVDQKMEKYFDESLKKALATAK